MLEGQAWPNEELELLKNVRGASVADEKPGLLKNVCEMGVARSHGCSKTYAKWAELGATVT